MRSRSTPIRLLMVLMSETPSAPPACAACAASRMSPVFGVSLTRTGVFATSFTQRVISVMSFGSCPTLESHAALAHAVGAPEVELEPVAAGVLDLADQRVPVVLRLGHQRDDDGVLRVAALHLADLAEVHLERAVGDELDVVEAHDLAAA